MPRLTIKPTLVEYLDEMPPGLVRLLARDIKSKQRALTNLEIAKASGLHPKRVAKISMMTSWADLTVAEVDAFRSACGVTPLNMKWHRAYLKRSQLCNFPLAHLKNRRVRTKFLKALLAEFST